MLKDRLSPSLDLDLTSHLPNAEYSPHHSLIDNWRKISFGIRAETRIVSGLLSHLISDCDSEMRVWQIPDRLQAQICATDGLLAHFEYALWLQGAFRRESRRIWPTKSREWAWWRTATRLLWDLWVCKASSGFERVRNLCRQKFTLRSCLIWPNSIE